MPSGELLVRQALYGQRYFERTFGARHRAAWLPDTFGFSPALPQILKGAGLTTLYTVKIGWSETNRFPHSRFWWEGIDGSRLLVHHMIHPEDNYNGMVTPRSLLRALAQQRRQGGGASEVLLPIGFGDGGGGPTAEMIAAQAALADFPLLPRPGSPRARLLRQGAAGGGDGADIADLGRRALSRVPPRRPDQPGPHQAPAPGRPSRGWSRPSSLAERCCTCWAAPAPASLEPLWRTLMINQFHDILPGSSIPEVYARTEPELAGVVAQAEEVAGAAMDGARRAARRRRRGRRC